MLQVALPPAPLGARGILREPVLFLQLGWVGPGLARCGSGSPQSLGPASRGESASLGLVGLLGAHYTADARAAVDCRPFKEIWDWEGEEAEGMPPGSSLARWVVSKGTISYYKLQYIILDNGAQRQETGRSEKASGI